MPIPATTSSDVLLRILLDRQLLNFDGWIRVEELVPVTSDGREPPKESLRSIHKDLEYLGHHRLLTFRGDEPEIRLTPLGVYTALLFEPASSDEICGSL
jgi:hypothetical protein